MKKKIEKHLPRQCLLLTNNPFVHTHSTQCSPPLPHLVGTAIIRHQPNLLRFDPVLPDPGCRTHRR